MGQPLNERGRLRVATPENVEFEFEIAHLASRFAAWAIDSVVISVLYVFVALLVLLLGALAGHSAAAPGVLVALYLLLQAGYFSVVEYATGGRSIGKRRIGLRVLQESGVPVSAGQILVRNAMRLADLVPLVYGVGACAVLLSWRGQRLGDLVAGTVVVREERRVAPRALRAAVASGSDAFADPELRRRIVETLSFEERDLLVQLRLRRHALDLDARVRLLARTAELLENRLGAAKPAHLSDERFVLGVAGVLAEGEGR